MTILLAIGEESESSRPVSVGYNLATTYDETLVGLHVVPEADFEEHRRSIQQAHDFPGFSFTQEEGSAATFARERLKASIDNIDQARVDTQGRVGDPASEILSAADSLDPRFLVIGGKKRSPVGKAIFGSVTQEVLLNATCPVVTALQG